MASALPSDGLLISLDKDKIRASWKYVQTLIRRDSSIKEVVNIESLLNSNKLILN